MEEELVKTLTMMNEAIQQVGGAAARIWPDLVGRFLMRQWMGLIFFLTLAICACIGIVMMRARIQRLKTEKYSSVDDEICMIWVLSLVTIIMFGIMLIFVPNIIYPEAGFIISLTNK